jgi:hypothetical protein
VAYEYTEMFGDPIEGGMHLGELSDVNVTQYFRL